MIMWDECQNEPTVLGGLVLILFAILLLITLGVGTVTLAIKYGVWAVLGLWWTVLGSGMLYMIREHKVARVRHRLDKAK